MMIDENDKQPPTPNEDEDEPKTVAMHPRPGGATSPVAAPPPAGRGDDDGEAEPPTVMASSLRKAAPPEAAAPPPPSPPPPPPPPPAAPVPPVDFQSDFQVRSDGRSIQVGDVLNHMFEVKRFIARGGMGEVFEGINVNSEERVAIKVMLPSLAADENVQAMFRKEARTLTRLQHESLVQYRTIAQEPQLGVLYIVTEYIDGTNLSDVLATQNPTPQDLATLLRRLASGLATAHSLGAIHRDLSPDNVLLKDGRIDQPKVIDFGIAKDVANNTATIIGSGFAGKLNYVAPEQLGDFGRDIGPWTDVYSLGLVILATAMGRNVALGGSLVDAVDKRRAGIDVSAAPAPLRPVLSQMLKANPAERLRSMEAVIDALDNGPASSLGGRAGGSRGGGGSSTGLIIGIVAALLLALVAVGVWWLTQRDTEIGAVDPGDPVALARGRIDSAMPNINCAWLDVVDLSQSGDQLKVRLTGVAGNVDDARGEIVRTLGGGADVNVGEVATITQAGCSVLNGYKLFRSTGPHKLTVPQREFPMTRQGPGKAYEGKMAANSIVTMDIGDPALDFTLVGIEPSGVISEIFPNRAAFAGIPHTGYPIRALGNDRYDVSIDLDHAGWSGLILVTGRGPFDKELTEPALGARGTEWQTRLASAAADQNWRSEMIWFKSVQ
ncbi:serine/threonine-protein kinase [Sphingomonas sanxanigenens]|uniref:Protein kinase domain-containing protein n=1 Tax=Sphingomonas sanxanigenens DSM 19645 = NX02 TaxID=1123269 RepID=W0AL55_9SPHN|nr:serine/threonine-protein kinase [Sphingomonas sanxanigenens]AHE57013.1 hypothetical protein NX02_27135 [Sphingomonas sanxanigenens DSM 19645 = NX02]